MAQKSITMFHMKAMKSQNTNGAKVSSQPGQLPNDEPKADGRVNRSVVTRQKIVSALTELIYEGSLSPTAEQVAKRADVGLRTVFRHFDDMDSLYREINSDLEAQLMPMQGIRLVGAGWEERLLNFVQIRSELYDRIAAMHLAGQVHRHNSAYVNENVVRAVNVQREQLTRILPDLIRQNVTLFEALDLLISMDSWIRLRRDQGLSSSRALDVVRFGLKSLLFKPK